MIFNLLIESFMAYLNRKIYGMMVAVGLLAIVSCTDIAPIDVDDIPQEELFKRDSKKWAEEEEALKKNKADSAAIAEENKKLREAYLADLREYKKSKHMVMFGWFAYWNPTSPDHTFSLDHLPDSVDFISNWGASWNLDKERKAQLARLQEKGTRMTVGWIIENIGDGLSNKPEGGWSNEPYKAIEQYAKAICDSIEKYGYDGIDIDYEPQFASPFKPGMHCGDWSDPWEKNKALISCSRTSNKEYENHFFKKIREFLPEEKMLNINGSIGWIDPKVADLFDYFVFQSYNGTGGSWVSTANTLMQQQPKVKPEQFIYTESFQTSPNNANDFSRYVKLVTQNLKGKAGGIGAFHINEDYLYGPNYKNVKAAISAMNPPFNN
ncbi:glycoside hydrolase family 18 [Bacteroides pyogenes]|uniref:glycoside hydrolase family 18 n=1 Tax=Bacteroides pyogenes TaxID=310300 RepID=UPI003B428119